MSEEKERIESVWESKRKALAAIRLSMESIAFSMDRTADEDELMKYSEAMKALAEAYAEVRR